MPYVSVIIRKQTDIKTNELSVKVLAARNNDNDAVNYLAEVHKQSKSYSKILMSSLCQSGRTLTIHTQESFELIEIQLTKNL